MALKDCLAQFPELEATYETSGITERAAELVADGATPVAAETQAIEEHISTLRNRETQNTPGAVVPVGTLASETVASVLNGTPLPGATNKMTAKSVAAFLDVRIAEAYGRRLDDTSDETKEAVVGQLVEEISWALNRSASGANWYSSVIESAMEYAALIHPELQTDQDAMVAFKAGMAITSAMAAVDENTMNAEQVYAEFKKTGKFPEKGFGIAADAMKNSFRVLNELSAELGWAATEEFLNKEFTVKELKDMGFTIAGELMGTKVNGSMIFGPKVGAFYQNLSGNYTPITMDRWFMRTWGRYTGTNLPVYGQAFPGRAASLRKVIEGLPRQKGVNKRKLMTDDEALMAFARKHHAAYVKSGFKDKTALNRASKQLIEGVETPVIVPKNGSHRNWIREVVEAAQDVLAAQGTPIDSASLQATLWYLEKDLYTTHGVGNKRGEPTDYEQEFRKLAVERLGAGAVEQSGLSGERSGDVNQPGSDGTQDGQAPVRLNQGFPYTYALADQSLEGTPPSVEALGRKPFVAARQAAAEYMSRAGIPYQSVDSYAPVDPVRAQKLAREYELMEHAPNDPLVKAAYSALIEEATAQFEVMLETGIEITFDGPDPYLNPNEVITDVIENNHMWVLKTDDAYGDLTGESDLENSVDDNPMLAPTKFVINGHTLLANDVFRAVHDYFGHVKNGVGFRPVGEENAWQSHASMFTPLARRALTSETRGQNSWLNYGPHGDTNRTAKLEDTVFAPQKTGLMPLWASEEGKANDKREADTTGRDESGKLITPPIRNGRISLTHSSARAGITRLDPEFYGDAAAGAERSRVAQEGWVNKTYFGIEPGTKGGYTGESKVSTNNTYTASVEAGRLYDFATNPDNLPQKSINLYEKAIRDAGYSGYWTTHPSLGMVAASFDPLLVEEDGSTLLFQERSESSYDRLSPEDMDNASRLLRAEELGYDTSTVYYHGTAGGDFDYFDRSYIGSQTTPSVFPQGFYFTTNRKVAEAHAGPEGEVRSFYLRKKNSLTPAPDSRSNMALFREFNKGAGDSYVSMDGETVVIRDPADIRSIHAAFDPALDGEPTLLAQEVTKRVKGTTELFKDGSRIIRLTQASDLSTFIHEAGHLLLEAEKQFAAEYGLSENQKAILKMLGVSSFDDIGVPQHEIFARTFEAYARTGKAPSVELRHAFAQFARWLTNIYKSIKRLAVNLDEEAIQVFDRLLATQEEIDAAAAELYDQFFKSQEQAGMSDAEWAKYNERLEKRKTRAEYTLYEKLVNELTKRRTKEWREERQPLIDLEKARLAETPVYKAEALISEVKLDPQLLRDALGIETLPPKLLRLIKKGAEDPGPIAEQMGFDSVETMINQIITTPTLNKAATDNAEAQMIAKNGDMLNDGSIEAEAQEAMHNEEQAKVLLTELRKLAKTTRKPAIDQDYLKAKAQELVSTMKYGDLTPEKYRRAEIRAAVRASKAKTSEDAYKAKVEQLANHHLFNQVSKARRDAIRYRDYIKGVQKRTYKANTVNPEYTNAMKQLAKSYDMTNKPKLEKRIARARAFLSWLNGQIAAGIDVNLKDVSMVELEAGAQTLPSFDQMTVGQLQSTVDMLKHLRFVGGQQASEAKAEIVAERKALIDTARATGTKGGRKKWRSDKRRSRSASIQHFVNLLPSLRNLVRTLDGAGTAFYDSIYRRMHAAEDTKLKIQRDFYQKFDELMSGLNVHRVNDTNSSARTVNRANGEPWTLSARQRLMLAAYWGTETGRQRIKDGFEVAESEVTTMLSYMTTDELNMVKAIWAHSDHMMKPVFEATVLREGVPPSVLVHMPFTINGVSMPGGHMRLFYGDSTADLEERVRLDETPLNAINSITPSLAASAQERLANVNKKPLLDTSNIFRNLEENAHFIAYAKAASELQTVFNNKEVRSAIAESHGAGFDRVVMQSIQGLTTNFKEKEGIPALASTIRNLRYAKSMMYLAYGLKNIVQGMASVVPAMAEVGPLSYVNHFVMAHADWAGTKAFVEEKSAQMRGRKAHLDRDQADAMKRVGSGSAAEAAFNTFAKHGFTPHIILDSHIAYPVWMTSYNQGMEAHGDEQKAIIDADVAVAETVGSGMDLHVGKVLRSNETSYVRMLTIFGSWFNSTIYQRAYKATAGGKKFLSGAAFEALVITPLLTMAISELIVANIPKGADDDDPWWKWTLLGYTGFMGATLPVVGDLIPAQSSFKPSTVLEDALYGTQSFVGELAGIASGDTSAIVAMENFIKTFGSVAPLPGSGNLVRGLDYLEAVLEGDDEFNNVLDLYPALVEGSDKNPR